MDANSLKHYQGRPSGVLLRDDYRKPFRFCADESDARRGIVRPLKAF
jgi:hypothetical protein